MLVDVATVLLGVSGGFGAAVYYYVGLQHVRQSKPQAVGFWILSGSYIAAAAIIIGRLTGLVVDVPRGLTYLILVPIMAVPPLLHFLSILRARRVVDELDAQ